MSNPGFQYPQGFYYSLQEDLEQDLLKRVLVKFKLLVRSTTLHWQQVRIDNPIMESNAKLEYEILYYIPFLMFTSKYVVFCMFICSNLSTPRSQLAAIV